MLLLQLPRLLYTYLLQEFNNHEYLDGGIYLNNPAELGLDLAKMIKPTANRYNVLSLGTGLGAVSFDEPISLKNTKEALFEGTAKTLASLLNIALSAPQETVAQRSIS